MWRLIGRAAALLAYAALLLAAVPASAWLLLRAQTWTGTALAVAGLLLAALPAAVALWVARHSAVWLAASLVGALVAAGLLALVVVRSPDGQPPPESPVHHRFTRPAVYPRWSLPGIVPEIEQLNLGFAVMPYLDALFTREQGRRVAPFTLALYRDMERDPDFHRLGSALGWAYADLLGRPFDVGHYYLYVPRRRPAGPLPVLVFLHGSAGNFKAYTWIWSRLAEERGMVIIAPSYGFGGWRAPDSVEAVFRALDDAATLVPIDRSRVILAGLSNGGLGVSQAAAARPKAFRGLIYLSPVMDSGLVGGATFLDAWRGRPVLIVSGEADERIPIRYVRERAAGLRDAGVDVTERFFPGEDHFLIFSQPDAVLEEAGRWLDDIE